MALPPTGTLSDRAILVVEDEPVISMLMIDCLEDQGARVIGPVSTVDAALAVLASQGKIDGAFLDINLNGEFSYPVADLLLDRGFPFVFVTGYRDSDVPDTYKDIRRCEKPKRPEACIEILRSLWP